VNSDWLRIAGMLAVLLAISASRGGVADSPAGGTQGMDCRDDAPAANQEELAGSCQGEGIESESTDATAQERKQYIQDVLSRSRGIKLEGRQLVRTGAGFFVAPDGGLLTHYQLVNDCTLVSIAPTFGVMKLATTISSDEKTGLALLRADLASPGVASFIGSEGGFNREPAYMIGYPNLGSATTAPAVSPIEVLGSQKTVFGVPTIAIKGEVVLGYSGGPLLDSGGGIIGIVLVNATQTYAATGKSARVVGLALPSEAVRAFLRKHGIDSRVGLQLPPKPADRLLLDARPYMAQVGCWQ